MLKESIQVIRHYRAFGFLITAKRMIVCSLVLMAVIGVLYRIANISEMIYPFYLCSFCAISSTAIAFILSCVKNHLENVSIQCGNNSKIVEFSCDELFETLRMDKKIHDEVMDCYTDETDKNCEMSRYMTLRTAHFAVWYAKNMEKVSDFCNSLEYNNDVLLGEFKAQQSKCFDFIAEMFSEGIVQTSLIRHGEKMVFEKLESMRAFISE